MQSKPWTPTTRGQTANIEKALRFFNAGVQSADVDATGYRGFHYHFLEVVSGRRVWPALAPAILCQVEDKERAGKEVERKRASVRPISRRTGREDL